ncbi:MAG: T9SS type B sorting domain-containing protein, partial [Flavobacteriales bacterium]|nr:T9SS type B sorting domain-containing protein [Flavobacteriales bacterium]
VLGYEIYANENNGQYQLVGTRGPNGTSFKHGNLNIDSNYCYFVKAISNGTQKPSFSNFTCVDIVYPDRPDFAYLSSVSILDDRAVEMTAFHSGGVNMKYKFEKYDPNFEQFFEIATVTYLPLMGDEVYMVDQQNAPVNRAFQYRVSLIDSCNVEYISSNISRNIDLNAVSNSDVKSNAIFWNKYTGWDGNVSHYNLYRVQRGDEPITPFQILPAWTTSYEDNVAPFIDEFGEFCYYIEAVENLNSLGFSKSSWSRERCASQDPIFWIPNAIVYGGVNQIFQPVGGFLNIENYSMNIFNRWGQEIWTTDDFEVGWDGTYKGNVVPQGVYFYYIRYQGGDGTVFEQRGDVYFINDEK